MPIFVLLLVTMCYFAVLPIYSIHLTNMMANSCLMVPPMGYQPDFLRPWAPLFTKNVSAKKWKTSMKIHPKLRSIFFLISTERLNGKIWHITYDRKEWLHLIYLKCLVSTMITYLCGHVNFYWFLTEILGFRDGGLKCRKELAMVFTGKKSCWFKLGCGRQTS